MPEEGALGPVPIEMCEFGRVASEDGTVPDPQLEIGGG